MQNIMSAQPATIETPLSKCASKQDHDLSILSFSSTDHWTYALAQIRRNAYNSTTANVSSPSYLIYSYEANFKQSTTNRLMDLPLPGCENNMTSVFGYNFNSEPLSTKDIFEYRQLRSEHLLMRALHCFSKHDFKMSFVRLSRGIFMVQKSKFSEPLAYPSFDMLSTAMDLFIQDDDFTSIDTFTFDGLFNDMMEQTNIAAIEKKRQEEQEEQRQRARAFVPYTHTIGLRYTNPYNRMQDILVRGKIPLWCQTLLITEFLRLMPIAPGTIVHGILPFAKDIRFHFKTIPPVKDNLFQEPYPELSILYERFAMELSEPQMMLENREIYGKKWEDVQNNILEGILYCEIPDQTARLITSLSIEWAKTQGLS